MINLYKRMKIAIKEHEKSSQARLRKEFLPEALEIVEKPVSPTGHFIIIITGIIFLSVLLWSFISKIDQVAIARGKISTISGVQMVQPLRGGMIDKVCVKEGDRVKAGDAIMLLDNSLEDISVKSIDDELNIIKFENQLLNRLVDEGDISEYLNGEKNDKERQEITKYIYSMQTEYVSQKKGLEIAIDQNKLQLDIDQQKLEKLKQRQELVNNNEDAYQSLDEGGRPELLAVEKLELMVSEKEKLLSDYQELYSADAITLAQLEETENELEQLKKELEIQKAKGVQEEYEYSTNYSGMQENLLSALQEYEAQEKTVEISQKRLDQSKEELNRLKTDFTGKLTGLIAENNKTLNAQEKNLDAARVNFKAQKLVSPADGTIKTLDFATNGGVVTAAQIVATVVPDEEQIIVDATVPNKDIGFISLGQSVSVKLDSFNFQKYGKLDGKVSYISPDSIYDEKQGWIYKAKIAIEKESFEKKNKNITLGAGMECTVEIVIGKRRIIDFFLEPLTEHFDSSLKVQ